MILQAQELFLAIMFFPMVLTSSHLTNYIFKTSEVIACDMKCKDDETFIAILPKNDGNCPNNINKVDLTRPIELEQVCNIKVEVMDTIDAMGRPLENQESIFIHTRCLTENQTISSLCYKDQIPTYFSSYA